MKKSRKVQKVELKGYLTIEEAAERLECHRETIRRWISEKKLKSYGKWKRNVLLSEKDVERLKPRPLR